MDDHGPDDREFLLKFSRHHCGESFRALVTRHQGMVRTVAMRKLGLVQETEEVAQIVFTVLARKAATLTEVGSLGAWLHRVTILECRKILRAKLRERAGLQIIREHANPAPGSSGWEQVRAEVDDAFDRLSREDREVLVLHYIEGRTFPEAATRLRTTAEATRKRCSRALDRLTAILRTRGVMIPAAALGAWLAKEFSASAAWSTVPGVAKAAMAKAGTSGGSAIYLITTTMKATTVGCFAIGLLAPFCWELETGAAPRHRPVSSHESGRRTADKLDAGPPARVPVKFDLEMVRRAFARHDDSAQVERWREAELTKLMFALNPEELAPVLAALEDVKNKQRFPGIARALFARWAELDGPGAVERAMALEGFGKDPLRGAFVTWVAMDETPALAWLEIGNPDGGFGFAQEWLRWKMTADPAEAASGAERVATIYPEKKKELYREIVKEWALQKDAQSAVDWAAGEADPALRDDLLGQIVRSYGEVRGLKTLDFAALISDPAKRQSVLDDTLRWTGVRGGYRMMKDLQASGFSSAWSEENLRKFTAGMMVNRPDQLPVLAAIATSDPQRQRIYEGALEGIMWNEPGMAVDAANRVNDAFLETERGARAYSEFARRWFIRDPEGAERWRQTLGEGPKRDIVSQAANTRNEEAGR